jgi:hypothetical protein
MYQKIWQRNCARKKHPKSKFWNWNLQEVAVAVLYNLDQDHQVDEDLSFHQKISLVALVY